MIFRPIKDQITEAQVLLKQKGLFSGEATGKYSTEFRAAIKTFQGGNGLRQTGTLNRATLEAMKIPLTEYQKGIPVTPNSYANATAAGKNTGPRRVIFRATKDQIIEAQTILRNKGMYTGDITGKLNNETRAGLRKAQAEAGIKVTGTLNRITLEAMGIALTEKQLSDIAAEAR
ncbi:MAG TPA: peptidoglycan-binding domain-containing protein [Pyrinomonadaceae bacterium]|nr:peptidoglycan-binding domain-containing protein [Pyrinomonadaceae bacterium]